MSMAPPVVGAVVGGTVPMCTVASSDPPSVKASDGAVVGGIVPM